MEQAWLNCLVQQSAAKGQLQHSEQVKERWVEGPLPSGSWLAWST